MTVLEAITTFKLDKQLLAQRIGISQSSFIKKTSDNPFYKHKLSESETENLRKEVIKIGKELVKVK